MAAPKAISLLPREGFEYTTAGKIVNWVLTAGRVIVVLAELVVILAFLSRFWLDRQMTDLNEQIKERVALIRANQNFESQFRATAAKLTTFTQLTKDVSINETLKKIFAVVPREMALSQVSVDRKLIQVTGIAISENGIEGFIKNLESQGIGEVKLSQVALSTQGETGIKFTIKIPVSETGQ